MKTLTINSKLLYIVAAAIGILLLLSSVSCSGIGRDQGAAREVTQETIVVSRSSDPYYPLAQKIAQAETLALVDEFAEALEYNPRYVILVAAPQDITAERLLAIGRLLKSSDYYPGLGIITGSTVEKAEQLWARRGSVQSGNNYLGGDYDPVQRVYEPTIFRISDGANEKIALDKASLIDVLGKADYFYWTRHYGQRTWYWNSESKDEEEEEIRVADIPPLKPVVIDGFSCDSLRPWVQDNIALGFVDQGAAAYLGNVNSPFHTSALVRQGLSVPGVSSWKEFPLGLVAQVVNQVSTKAYFKLPQFFMLGDPRVCVSKGQPYRIISDTVAASGKRVIEGESSVDGFLAVKIENGADYGFLAIKGLTSASEKDPFFNRKLQMLDLGADKYILFLHQGGSFRIELSSRVPLGWRLLDPIADALDYSWVVMWLDTRVVNTTFWAWLSVVLFAAILLWQVVRRKRSLGSYGKIFLAALVFALVRLAYFMLRRDAYAVSADLISPTTLPIALASLGLFANVAGGMILIQEANKPLGKALGLVFALLPQFVLTGFYLVWITFMNLVGQVVVRMTMPWLWNYYILRLPAIVLLLEVLLVFAFYRAITSGSRRRA